MTRAAPPSLSLMPLTLLQAIKLVRQQKNLLKQLIRRDIAALYRGSIMGLFWSVLTPLMMLAIYTFVFSFVFQARWPGAAPDANKFVFAVVLFSGLIVHGFFTQAMGRSADLIVSNSNLVKRVVFPLELLVVMISASAVFQFFINMAVLLSFRLVAYGDLPWTVLIAPLALFPLWVMQLGVCWFFSALGVFLRDVGQFMSILTMILLFTAPIFYPISAVPEALQPLLYLNPLTIPVGAFRAMILEGQLPAWDLLGIYLLIALAVASIGHYVFVRSQRAFADVL